MVYLGTEIPLYPNQVRFLLPQGWPASPTVCRRGSTPVAAERGSIVLASSARPMPVPSDPAFLAQSAVHPTSERTHYQASLDCGPRVVLDILQGHQCSWVFQRRWLLRTFCKEFLSW